MQRAGAPPKGRPLSPAAGSTQEPSGESQSRAPVLFSGPQMAGAHLATARSSQLAARLRARSTRQPVHAPFAPTQPTVLQQAASSKQQQQVPGRSTKAPVPREELSEATRPTPSHHSIHSISTSHTSIHTYIVHITRTKAARATSPCGHSNPTKNSGGIAQKADEADSSGQPAASAQCPIAHTAAQSRAQFPGIWFLAHHPGFGFWLFKVGFAFDFDCRPRSSRVQWQTASSPAVTTPLLIARALALQSHPTRSGFV